MTVRSRPMRTPQSSMAIWLSVFLSINPSIDYLLRISSIYCVSLCHYVYLLFPPKYTKRFTNQKQSCWDHSLYHGFVDGKVSFTQIDAFGFRPLRTHISSYVYTVLYNPIKLYIYLYISLFQRTHILYAQLPELSAEKHIPTGSRLHDPSQPSPPA